MVILFSIVKRLLPLVFILLFLLKAGGCEGQLSVSNASALGLTPNQFIQNWLLGSGVTITNAKFNGSSAIITSNQAGSFIASGNALMQMGIDSGMVLTSGQADFAVGPNNTCGQGADMQAPGDPDLSILSGGNTQDKCVIEFDFIPLSDTIKFRYVFGSEELFSYCNQFNDPFGFFLSGPGISGPFSNNSTDIALMPGTSNYVTINNICSQSNSVWCNSPQVCGNSSYCHNVPQNGGVYYQYNALTYVFTAWHTVQPCATYHIKIAVADALDYVLDSGVFLEKGSFSSVSLTGPSPVCAGSAGNVYTTAPGQQNYQWSVSPGGIITSGGTPTSNTVTVTWQSAGQKTVSVTYITTSGCMLTASAACNVIVNPLPVPVITGDSTACLSTMEHTYLTQAGMNNYTWTVSPGGTIMAGGTSSSNFITLIWNSAGIQTVSVNYTDQNGCTAAHQTTLDVNVTQASAPQIKGPGFPCVRSGNNIYVTEPGMNSYLWSTTPGGIITSGQGTDTITVTWNIAGQQIVNLNYTDPTGCSPGFPVMYHVIVKPLPVPTLVGPVTPCLHSVSNNYLTEPGMHYYSWGISPGGIITSGQGTNSVMVTWDSAGMQSLSVLYNDEYNCRPDTATTLYVDVRQLPGPAGTIHGPLRVCAGSTGFNYSISPVPFAFSYTWSLPQGFSITSGDGTNSIVVDPGLASVSGNIVVHAVNDCGAGADSPPLSVTVNHPPQAFAGPDGTTCTGSSFTVSGASAINDSAVEWHSGGQGILLNSLTLSPTYMPAPGESGMVVLTLLVKGNAPCGSDTSVMALMINRSAMADAGMDHSSCGRSPLQISGSSAGDYTSLSWTTSGSGSFDDPSILHPVYFPASSDIEAGSIFLTLHALSAEPCIPVGDSMKLTFEPGPAASPGPDGSICEGMSYMLHGFQINHTSRYVWENDGKGILKDTGTLTPVYLPAQSETGPVKITLKTYGASACQDSTTSWFMTIFIYSVPLADAGMDQSIKYNTATTLNCEASGGSGNFQYAWEPASLLLDNSVKEPQTLNLKTNAVFKLTITDPATWCTATDSVNVMVGKKEAEENCILVHNVITPNGDGINDKLGIDCIEFYPVNKFEVFNRWGETVNSFENYNNNDNVWRGTNTKGEILPDGTYFYILTIKNNSTTTGWIFLRDGGR